MSASAILVLLLLSATPAPQPSKALNDEVWKGGTAGLAPALGSKSLSSAAQDELLDTAAFGLNEAAVALLLDKGEPSAAAKGMALHRALAGLRPGKPDAADREARARRIIERLLAAGAPPETTDRYGATALSDAVYRRADAIALLLLERGANPNAAPVWWGTPLYRAAKTGEVELVAALLARGAQTEATGRNGETALIGALEPERTPATPGVRTIEVVRLLLDAGAKAAGEGTGSALARAVRHPIHSAPLVALLLGMRPEIAAAQAPPALLVAADRGRTEAAKVLLPHVADLDSYVDWEKRTALMLAAANGHAEIVRTLLARGADASRKNRSGKTASQLADDERQVETLAVLLAHEGKAAPEAEGLDVLIWGGGKDAKAAGRWLGFWNGEAPDYSRLIQLAEVFPKVEPSASLPGLNPGFHVVLLGACPPAETRNALAVLKSLYPGVYARRVSGPLEPACPVVAAWNRTFLASVQVEGGASLSAAALQSGGRESLLVFSLRGKDGARRDLRVEKVAPECEATLTREASGFQAHTVCNLSPCEDGPDDIVTAYESSSGKIAAKELSSLRTREACDTGD